MDVFVDLGTLKKVYTLLADLKLEWLMTGGKSSDDDALGLVHKLIGSDKITEFFRAITKTSGSFDDYRLPELGGLAMRFFGDMRRDFREMSITLGAKTQIVEQTPGGNS